jgi:beta-glucosidase
LRALRGFTRIHLKAGESKVVTFTLEDRDLSYVNESGTRLIGPGKYVIAIGGGQPGAGAGNTTANFEIQGEQKLPR